MAGAMNAEVAIPEPKIGCDDLVPSGKLSAIPGHSSATDGNANIVDADPRAKCDPDCDTSVVSGHNGVSKISADKHKTVGANSSFSKPSGFEILSSIETDSFDCDDSDAVMPESLSDQGSGKRNRQISTDSNGSMAVESKSKVKKSTKKQKKSVWKSQDMEDIDRIIMELEGRLPQSINKPPDDAFIETSAEAKALKESKKLAKKAAKKNITVTDSKDAVEVAPVLPNELDKKTKSKTLADCQKIAVEISEDVPKDLQQESDSAKGRKRPGKKVLAVIHAALRKAKEDEERALQEELAKQRKVDEAEKMRLEQLKLEQEKKERKKQKEKDKKQRLKAEGKFLTKSQRLAKARGQAALSAWREHGIEVPDVVGDNGTQKKPTSGSTSTEPDVKVFNGRGECPFSPRQRHMTEPGGTGDCSFENIDDDPPTASSANRREEMRPRTRAKSESDAPYETKELSRKSRCKSIVLSEWEPECSNVFRSPVVCVLGHVDTGKTKILDKIRKTHIQDNEAGGITQQIGATMFPREALIEKCGMVKSFMNFDLQLPGLLIIDTPGHESFRNMRSRGSSLCDMAVLVVDVMHGIENQTVESIELLKQRKTPFVVALNKIDRLYGWKSDETADVEEVIKRQQNITVMEFDKRCKQVIAEFANHNLNAALYYENTDPRTYVSLVPVSAVSGDGMGNLLAITVQLCQNMLAKQLKFSDELEATVLEVKVTAGLGTTIDVILVNGHLKETDTLVLVGQDGPIVTQIRSLLMPQPLRELRVKNPYREFKTVQGAQGIKITGKDLDKVIAGMPLFVPRQPDEIATLKEKAVRLLRNTINSIKLSERGVYVQASTLGSLEALLNFLKNSDIPYAGVKVGPVVKKDVVKASVMLEHDVQFAVILAFDVKIERDAQEMADHSGIKIFQADIIYHLFDNYVAFRDELREKKLNEMKKNMIFPCKLSVLPDSVFNIRNPIVLGVRVVAGVLKIGTPLCVPSKNCVDLGTVSHIEVEQHPVDRAKEGDDVCIKIEPNSEEAPKSFGKHFEDSDLLVSKITRQSIDVCKEFCRDDLQRSDWNLVVELKRLLNIV